MKPAPFAYVAPRDLREALEWLARHGSDAKVLAGGQSLVPLMNMRLARPAVLVDLGRIVRLDQVVDAGDAVVIGALARQRRLERDPIVRARAPLLAEAAPLIGHVQTRARGTVCGSLAHADPAAELPACAVALDAKFRLASARGRRTVAASAFYRELMTTALEPDEVLVEVAFPVRPAARTGSSFVEVARRHGDFALVGVAAVVDLDEADRCRHARLVFLGAAAVPHHAEAVSSLLGVSPDAETIRGVAADAARELTPHSDLHATAAYRRRVAQALAEQALRRAIERARAGSDAAPTVARASSRTMMRPGTDAGHATSGAPSARATQTDDHVESTALNPVDVGLTVNGVERRAAVAPRMLLADVLRDTFGLTGTHLGCEHGVCGACTVLMHGEPVRSCLVFAVQAEGAAITTVEGLAPEGGLHPLQEAFRARHALQCGYCTPGILMTLVASLADNPAPTEREVREALSGTLCRCTGYQNIVAAALDAAAALRGADAAR